jgi:uncharacterized membrane protein YtjA (UPF0391 family)
MSGTCSLQASVENHPDLKLHSLEIAQSRFEIAQVAIRKRLNPRNSRWNRFHRAIGTPCAYCKAVREKSHKTLATLTTRKARRKGRRVVSRNDSPTGRTAMLSLALTFLIIALIAGLLGFTGVYVAAAGIAKILFVVFLVLFVISLAAGGLARRDLP